MGPSQPARSLWRRARRPLLALLALGALSPAAGAGCIGGFDPPSLVSSLRVFAVTASTPYAKRIVDPDTGAMAFEDVTFKMTYYDGYPEPDQGPRPVQIVWLGGCFNPPGDQYFGCYEQLAEIFAALEGGGAPNGDYFQAGIGLDEYTMPLPPDLISSREPPNVGPYYGLAYVFFAVCAGEIRPVLDEGGRAGAFPLGCFNPNTGQRLGSESFVPGYTQIYAFDDDRENQNPELQGLTLDGEPLPEEFDAIPTVQRCDVTEEDRRVSGCGKEDPFTACTPYEIEAMIDPAIAEIDTESTGQDGEHLTEVVWVDYFADQGDFKRGIKLVNDAVEGFNDEREVKWIPPSEPGVATLWAVLHDARGGASVVQRLVRVE